MNSRRPRPKPVTQFDDLHAAVAEPELAHRRGEFVAHDVVEATLAQQEATG